MTRFSATVDEVSQPEWDQLLPLFRDATIYQTWSYGAVRWGERSLSHVVLREGDAAVGLAQVAIRHVPMLRCGIAYLPWGPVWRRGDADPEAFRALVRALRKEYAKRRGLLLRIAPFEEEGNDHGTAAILAEEGFVRNGDFYRTWMIDLATPAEELRRGMSRRWRQALKKAERLGLEIEEGTGDELLGMLRVIYDEMVARKGFVPGTSIEEFEQIQRMLPDAQKMRLLIGRLEGEPVTSMMVSRIGDTGLAVLGATGAAGLSAGSTHMLNERIMMWLRDSGARYYDFGGYDPANEGTASFKNGVPGADVSLIGRYEASSIGLSRLAVPLAERLRDGGGPMGRVRARRAARQQRTAEPPQQVNGG